METLNFQCMPLLLHVVLKAVQSTSRGPLRPNLCLLQASLTSSGPQDHPIFTANKLLPGNVIARLLNPEPTPSSACFFSPPPPPRLYSALPYLSHPYFPLFSYLDYATLHHPYCFPSLFCPFYNLAPAFSLVIPN